jgi:hypothetical protein
MWSYDEDGNQLYVFHARTAHNGVTGRDTFVRRVHFAADGMPIFDMEADEEVSPDNRSVTVQVTVTERTGLDVTAKVDSRCVVGKVVQIVTLTNNEDVAVTVTSTSPYGTKTTELAPGKSVTHSFSSRQASIPEGTVQVTATSGDITSEQQVAFPITQCG